MHPYVYPADLAVDDHNGWSDVERATLTGTNPENDQVNFGALLTSVWQPKLAAGVLAR